MEEKPIIGTGPRPPRQRLEYAYDSQSRRIAKRVLRKTHELGDWSLHQHRQFLYDGWNMIGELDVPTPGGTARLHRSYAWGLDASGTLTGAGGVGGLLLTTHYAIPGSGTSSNVTLAPLYDLNANVLAYAEVTTSTITHRIDYDPFGNELTLDTLLPTAAAEEAPRFRFSTKYTDSESGLVYYGFRSYSPELGRWVNRDPIEERGGVNLYGMVGNDAVNRWDLLGLWNPISGLLEEAVHQVEVALLEKGVSWSADKCHIEHNYNSNIETRYIQVMWGYGGSGRGIVDSPDGPSTWQPENPNEWHVFDKGTPYYPQENANDPFLDSPTRLFWPVRFEVCRVCFDTGCRGCAITVGPCRRWNYKDSGDLAFAPAAAGPSSGWWRAVNRKYKKFLCSD